MTSAWLPILSVAVVVLALAQVGLLVVAAVASRRLLGAVEATRGEVAATLERLDATLTEVGGLAADTRQILERARQGVERVGALAGAGRSLVEGLVGAALWQRLFRNREAAAPASGAGLAVRMAGQAAAAIWGILAERRARRRAEQEEAEEAEPAPPATQGRPPLRAGPVRPLPPAPAGD